MHTSFKHTVVSAVLSLALLSGGALYAKVVDKTLAIVNGEAIMQSEFDKTVNPVIEQYKQSTPPAEQSPEKIKDFKQKLLDQMIDDKLLKQEAKKQKIRITKREVEEGIKQVKKRFNSDAEFQTELKKENLTLPEFEKRIEEQLMVMKLIEQEIKAKTRQPTDEEVRAFYDQVQQKMAGKNLGLPPKDEEELAALAKYMSRATSEQVRARHILITVNKNATMAEKSEALKKIKKIQQELKAGADFGDLAKKYSEDPGSASRGGDLGYFSKGDMVPEFEKVAFSMNVGQVSDPVLTDFGYHLIKVEEKRSGRKLSYDDVKNDLKELLYQKAAQQRYEEWIKGLRAGANIKTNPIE
jgi:parvulin-like peptidyl-prolyl isomerase